MTALSYEEWYEQQVMNGKKGQETSTKAWKDDPHVGEAEKLAYDRRQDNSLTEDEYNSIIDKLKTPRKQGDPSVKLDFGLDKPQSKEENITIDVEQAYKKIETNIQILSSETKAYEKKYEVLQRTEGAGEEALVSLIEINNHLIRLVKQYKGESVMLGELIVKIREMHNELHEIKQKYDVLCVKKQIPPLKETMHQLTTPTIKEILAGSFTVEGQALEELKVVEMRKGMNYFGKDTKEKRKNFSFRAFFQENRAILSKIGLFVTAIGVAGIVLMLLIVFKVLK